MAYSEYCPVTKLYSLEKFCYFDCIHTSRGIDNILLSGSDRRAIVFTYLQFTAVRKHRCLILKHIFGS